MTKSRFSAETSEIFARYTIDEGALSRGLVRFCSPDTGDEETHFFGQTVCISDGSISQSASNSGPTQIEPFVFGGTSEGINMPDTDFRLPAITASWFGSTSPAATSPSTRHWRRVSSGGRPIKNASLNHGGR
jgi:hypothetical protein